MPTLVLLPLLRQCSSLEELSIPHMDSDENATEFFDIILRYCRNIKALRLSNHLRPIVPGPQFPPGYPSQELFRVANIYRGLREIGMVVRPEEEYPIMPTLLFYSGGSLEVIDLGIYCTNFFPARNPFIANILQDCGRLKTFSIRNLGIGKSCISLRDLVRTNWTSNQLERLEILVIEAGYPNEDDTSNADELSLLSSDEIQEQYEEDTAMFLVQLSMKYHAQKKYIGGPPSWYEAATNLLPYETAVDRVGGVMNPVVWKRVRVAPASVPPPNNVE
ncbi:hypothetical protein EC991_001273 [Linnemannia zychae]|nr:hypothetical protein EC991_001273 [Linnemannia zychae]